VKIRLYVEGGPKGTHANGLRSFRNNFKQHLIKLDPRLSVMDVSPCGSTVETLRDYARAIHESNGGIAVSALVDSDTAVNANSPAAHLQPKLDSAKVPTDARVNIFLMVQCMESWFVCDEAALRKCFGNQLRTNVLPPNQNIEAVAKKDVLESLEKAAKPTPAGRYHKVQHGVKILENLNPDVVAQRSKHARDLYSFLRNSICK
jgi:hypothetical protein